MNIKITKDEKRACVEVVGICARVDTILNAIEKGMNKIGIGLDWVCDAGYIKNHLDAFGEFDYRERAIFDDDDGVSRDHGMYYYINLTNDCNGNYTYGCVVLNREFYSLTEFKS